MATPTAAQIAAAWNNYKGDGLTITDVQAQPDGKLKVTGSVGGEALPTVPQTVDWWMKGVATWLCTPNYHFHDGLKN